MVTTEFYRIFWSFSRHHLWK